MLPFFYGGSNGPLTNNLEDARLFRRFGASRLARTVCAAPTGAALGALYGGMPGVAYEDYASAKLIVLWGCNAPATGLHLMPHVKRAQKQGGRLVVVDPRRTPLARMADLHLPVRPGTDLPVALAVIRELFARGWADEGFLAAHADGTDALRRAAEPWPIARAASEAGLDAGALATFAEWYGTTAPAVVRCGWGQERNRNGGSSSLAILALPAVGGKFGVRGGGYTMSNGSAWGLTSETLIGVPAPATREINMNQLGRALTGATPPVAVLFVYNCNPLATMPEQNLVQRGLAREDLFTVVHEQVMTDTARFADVLLPATTFLEHYDIAKGYGAYHLHMVQPAIAPVDDARPNHEVFRALASRLGLADGDDGLGETDAVIDAATRLPSHLSAALMQGAPPPAPGGGRPVQYADVHPGTPNGRIQLFPTGLRSEAGPYVYLPDPGTAQYPLSSDLARQRAHHLVDAGRAPAGHRQTQDAPRRRAGTVDRRGRRGARLQRTGRGPVRGHRDARGPHRHGRAAQGPLVAQHLQRRHRQCARARHAQRHRRRRLLQRRACPGRALGEALNERDAPGPEGPGAPDKGTGLAPDRSLHAVGRPGPSGPGRQRSAPVVC